MRINLWGQIQESFGFSTPSLDVRTEKVVVKVPITHDDVAGHFGILPAYKMAAFTLMGGVYILQTSDWCESNSYPIIQMLEIELNRIVIPGDLLEIEVTVELADDVNTWNVIGKGMVSGELAFTTKYVLKAGSLDELKAYYERYSTHSSKVWSSLPNVVVNDILPHDMTSQVGAIDGLLDSESGMGYRTIKPHDCFRAAGSSVYVLASYRLLEAIGQTCGCRILSEEGNGGKIPIFFKKQSLRIRSFKPVLVGQVVYMLPDKQESYLSGETSPFAKLVGDYRLLSPEMLKRLTKDHL